MSTLIDCIYPTGTVEVIDASLTVPAVVISGLTLFQGQLKSPALSAAWTAPTDPNVLGIQFEYQENTFADGMNRTSAQSITPLAWTGTNGVVAGKTYRCRWRAVGDGRFGVWSAPVDRLVPAIAVSSGIENQGDLATENEIDTPHIGIGAACRITSDQSIGSAVTFISAGGNSRVLLKTLNFTYDFSSSKLTVTVFFYYNGSANANDSHVYLKIGTTAPTWTSGQMTNADAHFSCSYYNGPATAQYVFTGLSAGTNTLEIWGNSIGSGAHINSANDALFAITQDNRTL